MALQKSSKQQQRRRRQQKTQKRGRQQQQQQQRRRRQQQSQKKRQQQRRRRQQQTQKRRGSCMKKQQQRRKRMNGGVGQNMKGGAQGDQHNLKVTEEVDGKFTVEKLEGSSEANEDERFVLSSISDRIDQMILGNGSVQQVAREIEAVTDERERDKLKRKYNAKLTDLAPAPGGAEEFFGTV